MIKAYKYRIYPNSEQRMQIAKTFGCCRFVYNQTLAYRKRYPDYLRKHFWKEHTFWTDGYFVCSVGNVSEEMLRKYIENQG